MLVIITIGHEYGWLLLICLTIASFSPFSDLSLFGDNLHSVMVMMNGELWLLRRKIFLFYFHCFRNVLLVVLALVRLSLSLTRSRLFQFSFVCRMRKIKKSSSSCFLLRHHHWMLFASCYFCVFFCSATVDAAAAAVFSHIKIAYKAQWIYNDQNPTPPLYFVGNLNPIEQQSTARSMLLVFGLPIFSPKSCLCSRVTMSEEVTKSRAHINLM